MIQNDSAAPLIRDASLFPSSRLRWADQLGFSGLLFIAFFGLWFGDGYRTGLALTFIAFIMAFREIWSEAKRSVPFWLALAYLVYLCVRHIFAGFELGYETLDANPRVAHFLRSSPFVFIIASVWLRNSTHRLGLFLAAAGLGSVVWIVKGTDWSHLWTMVVSFDWATARGNLHTDSVNRVPFISLAIALGLLTVGLGFSLKGKSLLIRSITLPSCLLLAVLFLFLVYVLETRSVYVAALISLPVVFFGLFWIQLTQCTRFYKPRYNNVALGASVLSSLGLAAVVLMALTSGSDRFNEAFSDIHYLFSHPSVLVDGELNSLEDRNISARLILAQNAIQAFMEKPLFGWGAGSSHLWTEGYGDFHNWALDVLVALGLIGTALYFGILFYLLGLHIKTGKRSITEQHITLFAISFLLAFSATQLFTTWMTSTHGRYFIVLSGVIIAATHTKGWISRS